MQSLVFPQSIFTLQLFFFVIITSLVHLSSCCWFSLKQTPHRMRWSQFSDMMLFYPAHLVNIFWISAVFASFFFPQRGLCHFPNDVCRGPNEWCLVLRTLLLCLREFSFLNFILFFRKSAETSFRPWSLWTGSVALIAQVIDQKESTVIPSMCWGTAAIGWWSAGGRVCTVCLSVFLFSLLSLGGSCCFIHPGPETCIKLY